MSTPSFDRKPSKDLAFEKKREEHIANTTAIEAKIAKLRQRNNMIMDEVRELTASDTDLAAREELRSQIEILKAKRDQLNAQKSPLLARLKESQAQFRRKMDEIQAAKDKLPFKRVEDVDRQLEDYDNQLTSGQLKLIDEKRLVAEMSKLRKLRKQIETFNGDSSMVDLKNSIDSLKSILSEKEVEIKLLQEQLNSHHESLNKMSSSRSAAYQKIKKLYNERNSFSETINTLNEEKNALKVSYGAAVKAHQQWFQNQQLANEERFIQRQIDNQVRDLEHEIAALDLPANSGKIQQAVALQNYLKNSILKENDLSQSKPASAPGRQVENVDESLIMKTKFNKEEETYMNFGKSKKTRAKKTMEPVAQSDSFKLPVWILADFEALSVKDVPLACNKEQICRLIDDLEASKDAFEKDQQAKSSNVDALKRTIEAKIAALKARNVHEEAVKAVKQKEDQRKASMAAPKGAPGLTVQG